jgi:hypothetical protein
MSPHACRLVCCGSYNLQVADLNALAELGKVYQDSLALSAQLRNLSSFRLQQDKVLGRGSLAVVQEGEFVLPFFVTSNSNNSVRG